VTRARARLASRPTDAARADPWRFRIAAYPQDRSARVRAEQLRVADGGAGDVGEGAGARGGIDIRIRRAIVRADEAAVAEHALDAQRLGPIGADDFAPASGKRRTRAHTRSCAARQERACGVDGHLRREIAESALTIESRRAAMWRPVALQWIAVLVVAVVALTACEKTAPPKPLAPGGRTDDAWGFSFVAPGGWNEGEKGKFTVPGELRYAFVSADAPTGAGASITLFLQKPGKELTARKLLDGSIEGMKKASAEVKAQEVRPIGGMTSMWLEVVGPGTGAALGPGGAVKTTQVWAAVPRGNDVLVLLLTAPEASAAAVRPAFDAVVQSLTLTGAQTPDQKSST
jgi:hypothetical protein